MINDIIEIAKEAGEIIREGFGKTREIEFKTNETNLVTEIDKASEKLITDFIKIKYPSHGILAEESGQMKSGTEYMWVIDPLDGTTNFAHGLPVFAVSIGLQKNDKTVAGVVYDVMFDVVYSAEKGSGAFANHNKMIVSKNNILGRSVMATGFPYNVFENPDNLLERFAELTKRVRGVRRLGSAALDLCYTAKGVFDGYWEMNLSPWDICAGMLLVEEAGGVLSNFNNKPIDMNTKKILASNGLVHEKMLEILSKYE
ncbi:MAG TPA: inositol monophosphatase family protein [Ignavibacteriaceae bacterium]|nr:inositol monophosphatase family protein [Ignavibacteriaceae bacterium]